MELQAQLDQQVQLVQLVQIVLLQAQLAPLEQQDLLDQLVLIAL
jgi:hypothetical protein